MHLRYRKTRLALLALAGLAIATAAPLMTRADDYPSKPIRIISDSAPGSAVDVTFRMVMDRLGKELGQQIVPVAQPGASGAIAAHAASEAVPDGYTLFAPAISLFISLPGKAPNLPVILPRDSCAKPTAETTARRETRSRARMSPKCERCIQPP